MGLKKQKGKSKNLKMNLKLLNINKGSRQKLKLWCNQTYLTAFSKIREIMNEEGIEENLDANDVIEDARRTKFYFRKMQMIEGGSFIFALISIFISIIEVP